MKNKNFKIWIFQSLFFLLFLISCKTNTERQQITVIDIQNCIKADTLFIEDLFDQEIIFLDGSDTCFINSLANCFFGEKIILFDSGSGGRVFVCNQDGKNLKEVNIKGHGIGELPFIESIFVADKLYANGGPQLNIYNLSNFKFERKIESLDVQSQDFVIIDSVMISSYEVNHRNMFAELNYYNLANSKHEKLLPFLEDKKVPGKIGYSLDQYLTISESKQVLFKRKFENIIYRIVSDTIMPQYKIKLYDTDKFIIPEEERSFDNKPKYLLKSFFETNKYLFMCLLYEANGKSREGIVVHEKINNSNSFYKVLWSKELRTRVEFLQFSNGYIIGFVNVNHVYFLINEAVRLINNQSTSQNDLEWANYINQNIGKEMNPILLKLKEK